MLPLLGRKKQCARIQAVMSRQTLSSLVLLHRLNLCIRVPRPVSGMRGNVFATYLLEKPDS